MASANKSKYEDLFNKVKHKLEFLKNSNKVTAFSLNLDDYWKRH